MLTIVASTISFYSSFDFVYYCAYEIYHNYTQFRPSFALLQRLNDHPAKMMDDIIPLTIIHFHVICVDYRHNDGVVTSLGPCVTQQTKQQRYIFVIVIQILLAKGWVHMQERLCIPSSY